MLSKQREKNIRELFNGIECGTMARELFEEIDRLRALCKRAREELVRMCEIANYMPDDVGGLCNELNAAGGE